MLLATQAARGSREYWLLAAIATVMIRADAKVEENMALKGTMALTSNFRAPADGKEKA